MRNSQDSKFNIVFEALGIFAILAAMTYLITRGVLLERARYAFWDGFYAVLVLLAEAFILIHGMGYAMALIYSQKKAKTLTALSRNLRSLDREEQPSVAVLVPARHEPKEVLAKTFITINNLEYKNKKVYFLDDNSQETFRREAEDLAKEHDLVLFRRTKPWHDAKAGIINDFLEQITEKYVVVFDADNNPMPDFLGPLVPIMETDEKLAFIQTPQFYTNTDTNRIARASALQQAVFYEYICDGKGTVDSMFCCGTNVIFRTSALLSVGGMDERTVTEDFATSIKLHGGGFSSLYYNHVSAFGMGPEDLISYFTQQYRWAAGTLQAFKSLLRRFLTRPFSMRPGQWIQYFLSATYYLVGFAYFILVLGPLLYIFFKVPSFFIQPEVYFLSFLPYIVLSMSVFYFSLRKRNYKPRDLVLGQLLGTSTCFVYMKAACAALLDSKVSFGVTSKTKGGAIPYRFLWPQLGMLAATFIALVWAVNRFYYEHEPALIINAFWTAYQFLVFSSIFYFNKAER